MISITKNNTKKYLACVAKVEKAKQSVREEQAFIKDYENAYKTFSKSHPNLSTLQYLLQPNLRVLG